MIQPEFQVVQGHPCYVWAEAISAQIADMITDHDQEDMENLENALYIALRQCPEAVEMLIGTPLVGENWFEEWERMEREWRKKMLRLKTDVWTTEDGDRDGRQTIEISDNDVRDFMKEIVVKIEKGTTIRNAEILINQYYFWMSCLRATRKAIEDEGIEKKATPSHECIPEMCPDCNPINPTEEET